MLLADSTFFGAYQVKHFAHHAPEVALVQKVQQWLKHAVRPEPLLQDKVCGFLQEDCIEDCPPTYVGTRVQGWATAAHRRPVQHVIHN